jgi:hypothetical protein
MDTRAKARFARPSVGLGLVVGSIIGAFSYYLFTGVVPWSVAAVMSGSGLAFAVYGALFPGDPQSALQESQRRRRDTRDSLKVNGAVLGVFVLATVAVFVMGLLV